MKKAINKFCPRSGDLVQDDSLTDYSPNNEKSYVVGFCNPGCRDDFASDVSLHKNDCNYFDVVIKELEL